MSTERPHPIGGYKYRCTGGHWVGAKSNDLYGTECKAPATFQFVKNHDPDNPSAMCGGLYGLCMVDGYDFEIAMDELVETRDELDGLRVEVDRLRTERDSAADAFRSFSWHLSSCLTVVLDEDADCDCGFHSAWDEHVLRVEEEPA